MHTCSDRNEVPTEPHVITVQLMARLRIMLWLLDRQAANCTAWRQRINFLLIFVLYKPWPQLQALLWHFERMLLSIPRWNEPYLKLPALLWKSTHHQDVAHFWGRDGNSRWFWQNEEELCKEKKKKIDIYIKGKIMEIKPKLCLAERM